MLETLKTEVKEWRCWNGWLCFEGRCSIQLSYGRVGFVDSNSFIVGNDTILDA